MCSLFGLIDFDKRLTSHQKDRFLNTLARVTGAFRVDVVKPAYKALDDTQVAKFSGHLTVSHKVESEVV